MAAVKKLSPAQQRALRNLLRGEPLHGHCRTQSDYGGLHGTIFSLLRRGLITPGRELTEEGRAAALGNEDGR